MRLDEKKRGVRIIALAFFVPKLLTKTNISLFEVVDLTLNVNSLPKIENVPSALRRHEHDAPFSAML